MSTKLVFTSFLVKDDLPIVEILDAAESCCYLHFWEATDGADKKGWPVQQVSQNESRGRPLSTNLTSNTRSPSVMSPAMEMKAAELFIHFPLPAPQLEAIEQGDFPVWPESSRTAALPIDAMENPEGFVAQTIAVSGSGIEAAEINDVVGTSQAGQGAPDRRILCRSRTTAVSDLEDEHGYLRSPQHRLLGQDG